MSFLKITDPKKRDLMIKEFLETKKNIQQDQLHERVGEREFQKDLGKFFKPVTSAQKKTAEEIKEELKPLKEIVPAIEGIPGPFHAPLPPPGLLPIHRPGPILYPEEEEDEEEEKGKGKGKKSNIDIKLGPIASEYVEKLAGKSDDTDRKFGIYREGGKFYIGDTEIKIEGNDIIVGNNKYEGTKGLWELIMSEKPDEIYNADDFSLYSYLMADTGVMYKDDTHPKSSKRYKWTQIVSPIWKAKDHYENELIEIEKKRRKREEERRKREEESEEESEEKSEEDEKEKKGSGLSGVDPNLLIERLDLLMESKKAGNTGVRNELISICNELKKQKILNTKQHKIILKKC